MWIFYAPVACWIGWLAVRYRGLTVPTAANPGMPDGGLVGESKFDILSCLPADAVVPTVRLGAGHRQHRMPALEATMAERGWRWPLVLKPDAGERGRAVRKIGDAETAVEYLDAVSEPIIVQPYHPGPYEAGIFYYRLPGSRRGRILSITDKHFPVLVGDGRSSIETLIWSHPRYRLQGDTFMARHAAVARRVLDAGERFPLAMAGNHCQGTLFRDGAHLITPALEARVDDIAQQWSGFFVGRFDVRYANVDEFTAGRDLSIVELNGVTAESTNIYDPSGSLLGAYRTLFRQWSIIFAIGAANRQTGTPVSSTRRVAGLIRAHLAARPALTLSD